MSRVWTAAEVESLARGDAREIVLHPGDLISPSARDIAQSQGVTIRRSDSANAAADCSCASGKACACDTSADAPETTAATASPAAVDAQVVGKVRALASMIAAANPGASTSQIAEETLSALGANGAPGVGSPDAAQPLPGQLFPKKAKGARPGYHDDPGLDAVVSTLMTLTSELWVLRERVMTLESLLADRRILEPGAVNDHHATGTDAVERMESAQAFVARVLRVFYEWREEIVAEESRDTYHEIIRRAYAQREGDR